MHCCCTADRATRVSMQCNAMQCNAMQDRVGEVLGLTVTIDSICRIVSPLLGGRAMANTPSSTPYVSPSLLSSAVRVLALSLPFAAFHVPHSLAPPVLTNPDTYSRSMIFIAHAWAALSPDHPVPRCAMGRHRQRHRMCASNAVVPSRRLVAPGVGCDRRCKMR